MAHEKASDTWERGSPYEQYVGRWSRRVAPLFLAWLGVPPGRRWLDVGCGTGALAELFTRTGLNGVEVTAIDIPTPLASFDDYWQPFLGGQWPAPAYALSLDGTARARLRDRIRQRLPVQADGSVSLTARAWAVRATVAKQATPGPAR